MGAGKPSPGGAGGYGVAPSLGQPPHSVTQGILTLVPEEGVPCSRLERVKVILVRNGEGGFQ